MLLWLPLLLLTVVLMSLPALVLYLLTQYRYLGGEPQILESHPVAVEQS